MGLFSWLSPSPEKRIQKAKKLLEKKKFADARMELNGLTHHETKYLLDAAHAGLVAVNLEHAISWAHAGDPDRVRIHMELAENFHNGRDDQAFKDTRRAIREIREVKQRDHDIKHAEREARLLAIDPIAGTGPQDSPHPVPGEMAVEDVELQARLAFLEESYPEPLRPSMSRLGGAFLTAVLKIEEGNPKAALPTLLGLSDSVAVVRYERARAAHQLSDNKAAARELRAFAELTPHCQIGTNHTGVMLAQIMAEMGQMDDALGLLRILRQSEPKLGGGLFAQLLEATNQLEEAETVLRELLLDYGNDDNLYLMLARVRLRAGHRVAAMRALESSMDRVCNAPGSCAHRPASPDVLRLLSLLYFEEGTDDKRALSLHEDLRKISSPTSWDDRYVDALKAKAIGAPNADQLAASLYRDAPKQLKANLEKYLPQ